MGWLAYSQRAEYINVLIACSEGLGATSQFSDILIRSRSSKPSFELEE
jgi:hypothetical protein